MSINKSERIWIACLGKRGGGVHLLRETEQILAKSDFSIFSIVSVKGNSSLANNVVLSTPCFSLVKLFRLITFPLVSFALFYKNRNELPTALIQIMPSPMDYWLDIWCRIFGVQIFRAIHDFQPHPGEAWPTKMAIKCRISHATNLFVFSTFVLENLAPELGKSIYKCSLPEKIIPEGSVSPELREMVLNVKRPLVLFIGRIRKYKGLDFFLETLRDYSKPNFSILIAGSGSINLGNYKNVFLWNHWLTESEMDFLLTEANVVVFPYLEASQSGVVPLAMKKNIVILATKVGSLEEQLEGYQRKVLVDPGDSKSLLKGLETSIDLLSDHKFLENESEIYQSMPLGDAIIEALMKKSEK